MKRCPTCKIEKPYSEFVKNKTKKDGYSHQCKECEKQYLIKNADKLKQYRKQYYQKNITTISERNNIYYHLNSTSINERHKTEQSKLLRRKCSKEYAKTIQGKLVRKAIRHKRLALLKGNTPTGRNFTADDIKLKLRLQKNKCVYCQVSIKGYYEIDHIIPAVKGGSNEAWNIQLLCVQCNGKGGKGTKDAIEFAQQYGKLI